MRWRSAAHQYGPLVFPAGRFVAKKQADLETASGSSRKGFQDYASIVRYNLL
jgi:hypothetical protein